MPLGNPVLPVFDRYVELPIAIPIQLVDKNRVMNSAYHMRHFDTWLAEEQLLENESGLCVCQKWQKNDIIYVQLISTFGPVRMSLRDSKGKEVLQQVMTQVAAYNGRIYWQNTITLSGLPEGVYKVYYNVGDPILITLEGETWDVKTDHPGTILLKYYNAFNNQVLWETGIYMTFRVDGVVAEYTPVGSPGRTVYIDQPGRAKTVRAGSARQFTLFIGNQVGSPPWVADKIEEILNQTHLEIDGKAFSADAGAKLSVKRVERYAWAQWSITIREADASRVRRFTATGILEKKFVEDVVVGGKLFGPLTGSSNDTSYTINSVQ